MRYNQQFTASDAVESVLERLSNPKPSGRDQWRATCPAHGSGRNHALSIRLEGDRILIHCFAGCDPEAVLQALGFDGWADLYRGVERPYSPPVQEPRPLSPDQGQRAKLERLWQSARPLRAGDAVTCYLEGRGLRLETLPASLRCHPALEYWRDGQRLGIYPAMLARVEHPEHGLVALHRTYLTLEGRKAPVPSPKKLTRSVFDGAVMGAAVRLYAHTDRLALAEGLETAFAVHLATEWRVWATVSAGGMARVIIPSSVSEVVVAADHDPAGLEAARKLARRLLAEGRRARLAVPPTPGADWLDLVAGEVV